jgi:hypothetical protein
MESSDVMYNREFKKFQKKAKWVRISANMSEFLVSLLDSVCIGKDGWFVNKNFKSTTDLNKFDYIDYIDAYTRLNISARFNEYDSNFAKSVIKIRRNKMFKIYNGKKLCQKD